MIGHRERRPNQKPPLLGIVQAASTASDEKPRLSSPKH